MSNREHFDHWAEEYNDDIDISIQTRGFPFEGYYSVLEHVQDLVLEKHVTEVNILDLGVGTGLLSEKLYQKGIKIHGIDFSPKMLKQAKQKMPKGRFFLHDFSHGMPKELADTKFDFIISSYALHHLPDNEKYKLLAELTNYLKFDGKIIVADISFKTKKDLADCRKEFEKEWDEEEYYLIGEEFVQNLEEKGFKAIYQQISPCAGVLTIEK
ncbi:MAG: methyltransferase domain-containing protein [Candidatus Heimdallarchaeota archaeon]|nr:methyltransferase domain-containing protein [Candidatus Heimdallarchaeota archaeon]